MSKDNVLKWFSIKPLHQIPRERQIEILTNRWCSAKVIENACILVLSKICKFLDLDYYSFEADPIKIEKFSKRSSLFIAPKALKESNYYKNLLSG